MDPASEVRINGESIGRGDAHGRAAIVNIDAGDAPVADDPGGRSVVVKNCCPLPNGRA